MRIAILTASFVAVTVIANAASACDPVIDERTLSEIKLQSKPVTFDRDCRTINAGVYDRLSLGPAIDLGDGRIQQVLNSPNQFQVLLADCNTREATILLGAVTSTEETSCGPMHTYADLAGENAMMKLDGGANLNELVVLAAAKGVTEISPSEFFFQFSKDWESELHPVGRKDRFDLLCGCKRFYPDSQGAKR